MRERGFAVGVRGHGSGEGERTGEGGEVSEGASLAFPPQDE